MKSDNIIGRHLSEVRSKVFAPSDPEGISENHSFVSIVRTGCPLQELIDAVISELCAIASGDCPCIRFVRFFLSDAANQQPLIEAAIAGSEKLSALRIPFSFIQQHPLDGTKIAAWVYSSSPSETFRQLWYAGMTSVPRPASAAGQSLSPAFGGSYAQMSGIFSDYAALLAEEGLSVAENCLRTWIFVRDIDVNYGGVVKGRKEYFDTIGLTADTHYIASTGIEGKNADSKKSVTMDAVALKDVVPAQIQYLYARDRLSSTADYGVTFERGTAVHYGDRTHVYISGTASIDSKGRILHQGDVEKQTLRMLGNVAALLSEAGATLGDTLMAIVYLRDMADYPAVRKIIGSECPGLDPEYVLAPVCRPGWLVEMECIAVTAKADPAFGKF